jgi:outer membrane protein, multidrug efflux system
MKTLITFIAALSLVVVFAFGCKTTRPGETPPNRTLPATFSNAKDTVSDASINWRSFFSDSILVNLIDTALKNNPDILMMLQKIEVANANVQASRGLLFPLVNAMGSSSIRKFGSYTMDGAGNITTEITSGQIIPIHLPDYYIGMQTSWEIDVWGKLRNMKRASLARYLASIEARNLAITELIFEITITYYDLVALDNELAIIRESIKLQNDAFNIILAQKEAGLANELAVSQFEAQLLNMKALEVETLLSITLCENKMNFLLGRFPQEINREIKLFESGVPANVRIGVPSALLANRPDIRQSEYELIACKADLKAAQAAFYPSLTITGTVGLQAFNQSYLFLTPQSLAYTALGSLTAPLINRNAIKAQFRAANANQMEAYYNYQKTILNGYIEVSNELAKVRNYNEILSLKTQEVSTLNRAIESSLELFRAGKATYLEVLLAQQNLLQTKLELVNIQQQQYNASAATYKALGGGWY